MRERFNFLSRYVSPETSERLQSDVSAEIESTRSSIMRFHRTAVLSPMITATCGFGEWVPAPEVLPSFILKPNEAIPPTVSPQLLQNAAHLFNFSHDDLDRLLNGLLAYKGTPMFNYAISSAIPSLFGYFSSHEHCVLALAFYLRVVNYLDAKLGFPVLLPFLSCPGMFVYIESCLNPFFDRLMRDPRFGSKLSSRDARELELIYARDLVQLFMKYMHLIPKCVLVVMELMSRQWGAGNTGKLIVDELLKSLSLTFIHATGRVRHETFLVQVFKRIDDNMHTAVISRICEEKPRGVIPDLFEIFGDRYLLFFSCVADVELIGFLMAAKEKLPPSLCAILANPKHGVNGPLKQAMFWFKVYPRRKASQRQVPKPLFFETPAVQSHHKTPDYQRTWNNICAKYEFPMQFVDGNPVYEDDFREFCLEESVSTLTDAARKLENVLWHRLWLQSVKQWLITAEEHARMMIMPIADLACTKAHNRNYASIEIAHKHACMLFDSRLIKQDQFMILIGHSLVDLVGDKRGLIAKLKELWNDFIQKESSKIDSVTSVTGSQTGDALFWDAVEGLSALDTEPFRNCYRIIIRSMKLVYHLFEGKNDNIIRRVILLSRSKRLISLYLAIKEYAMTAKQFTDLCTEEEEIMWVICERALLNLVMEREDIKQIFFQLEGHCRESAH